MILKQMSICREDRHRRDRHLASGRERRRPAPGGRPLDALLQGEQEVRDSAGVTTISTTFSSPRRSRRRTRSSRGSSGTASRSVRTDTLVRVSLASAATTRRPRTTARWSWGCRSERSLLNRRCHVVADRMRKEWMRGRASEHACQRLTCSRLRITDPGRHIPRPEPHRSVQWKSVTLMLPEVRDGREPEPLFHTSGERHGRRQETHEPSAIIRAPRVSGDDENAKRALRVFLTDATGQRGEVLLATSGASPRFIPPVFGLDLPEVHRSRVQLDKTDYRWPLPPPDSWRVFSLRRTVRLKSFPNPRCTDGDLP